MPTDHPKQEILRQADAVLKLCNGMRALTGASRLAYEHTQYSLGHGLLVPRYLDRYYGHLAERLCFLLNGLRLLDHPVLTDQSLSAPAVGVDEFTLVCQGELAQEFLDRGIFEFEVSFGPTRLPDFEESFDVQLREFSLIHQRIVAAELEMLRSGLASCSELLSVTPLPEVSYLDGFEDLLRIARSKLAPVVRYIDNSIDTPHAEFGYALEELFEVLPALDVVPTTAVALQQDYGIDHLISSGLLRLAPQICHTRRVSNLTEFCFALIESFNEQEL